MPSNSRSMQAPWEKVTQWKAGKGLKPLRQPPSSTTATTSAATITTTKAAAKTTTAAAAAKSSSSTTTKATSTTSNLRAPKDQASKADAHPDPSQSAPLSFESWQGAVASATNAHGNASSFYPHNLTTYVTHYWVHY